MAEKSINQTGMVVFFADFPVVFAGRCSPPLFPFQNPGIILSGRYSGGKVKIQNFYACNSWLFMLKSYCCVSRKAL